MRYKFKMLLISGGHELRLRIRARLFILILIVLLQWPIAHAQSIDVSQYQSIIERVLKNFDLEIKSQSATTEIILHENSSGIGAFTWRKNSGRTWEFHFYDGVLQVKNVTSDTLTLIVCHELGHHLSGYPFKEVNDWSSAEGQADFFATHACAPRVWSADDSYNQQFASLIPLEFKLRCDQSYAESLRRGICYRTIFAVDKMRYYEGYGRKDLPSLYKSDSHIVRVTELLHPSPQCRIDTQLAGAFCSSSFDFSKIPGHLGKGLNTPEAEQESAPSHCDSRDAARFMRRPKCWFAPLQSENPLGYSGN